MANPNAALNPNDPVARALQAEAAAKETYNNAGYHRNFLEVKIKDAEAVLKGKPTAVERQKAEQARAKAEAELPEAQKKVEIAQEDLKRAQTRLALLTGGQNPHTKQKVAYKTPEEAEKGAAEEKIKTPGPEMAPEKIAKREPEVKAVDELVAETRVVARPRAAYFESVSIRRVDIIEKLLQDKTFLEEMEKIIDKKSFDLKKLPTKPPTKGELLRYNETAMMLHGESMTRMPLLLSAKKYVK